MGGIFSEIHTWGTSPYFASNYTVDLIKLKSTQLSFGKNMFCSAAFYNIF